MKLKTPILMLCVVMTQSCQAQEIDLRFPEEDVAGIDSATQCVIRKVPAGSPLFELGRIDPALDEIELGENAPYTPTVVSVAANGTLTTSWPNLQRRRNLVTCHHLAVPSFKPRLCSPELTLGPSEGSILPIDQELPRAFTMINQETEHLPLLFLLAGQQNRAPPYEHLFFARDFPGRFDRFLITSHGDYIPASSRYYPQSGYVRTRQDHSGFTFEDLIGAVTMLFIFIPLLCWCIVTIITEMWKSVLSWSKHVWESLPMTLLLFRDAVWCVLRPLVSFVAIILLIIAIVVAIFIALAMMVVEWVKEATKVRREIKKNRREAELLNSRADVAEAKNRLERAKQERELATRQLEAELRRLSREDTVERANTFTTTTRARNQQELLQAQLSNDLTEEEVRENKLQVELLESQRALAEAAAKSLEERVREQDLNEGDGEINLNNSLGG